MAFARDSEEFVEMTGLQEFIKLNVRIRTRTKNSLLNTRNIDIEKELSKLTPQQVKIIDELIEITIGETIGVLKESVEERGTT